MVPAPGDGRTSPPSTRAIRGARLGTANQPAGILPWPARLLPRHGIGGGLSSTAEQRIVDPQVMGSKPIGHPNPPPSVTPASALAATSATADPCLTPPMATSRRPP